MAQNSTAQKTQIVADLQAISLIASVVPIDQVKDVFSIDWPNGLPGVIVPMPKISQSTKADSWDNDRTYTWELFVVVDNSSLDTQYDVEAIIDAVLNAFDNDETLGGNSWPSVEPALSEPMTITSADKTWTIIPITLKAHALIAITP